MLFSAFLVKFFFFASRCYSFFPVMFVYFPVENTRIIFIFSGSRLGLNFNQVIIYINENNIYL